MEMKVLAKEFIFDCKVRDLAPRTVRNYEKQLDYFVRFLAESQGVKQLEDLKPIHIKQFIAMLQEKKNKPSYVNDLLKAVKVLCRYAFDEGYVPELITKKVKNVKEPKVLIHTFSDDEIVRMVQFYDGNDYLSIRNRLMLMMLFDTGLRISEIMNLKPEQIRQGYFSIYGKGRKERVVPQNAIVGKWMMKYERAKESYFQYKNAEDYYFLSKNGKRLTQEAVSKFMKKAGKAVGVNPLVRVSPHTARHTFAHQELKNGLDLYSLSRLLGHESVSITQRYLEAIRDEQILTSAKKTGVLANL
ncbi:MAG: tyrosine-type recombinase/integrase [Oscillospiraceae bacterium]|nr:tyrosine-type recombinase/integrase [Oscillospiraceae bacterium]